MKNIYTTYRSLLNISATSSQSNSNWKIKCGNPNLNAHYHMNNCTCQIWSGLKPDCHRHTLTFRDSKHCQHGKSNFIWWHLPTMSELFYNWIWAKSQTRRRQPGVVFSYVKTHNIIYMENGNLHFFFFFGSFFTKNPIRQVYFFNY